MDNWIKIPDAYLIPKKEGRRLTVNGEDIALFNLGNDFLAINNVCPHKQGPLSDGIVSGKSVFCPLHNMKINLESGKVEKPTEITCRVKTYPLKKDGETLYVQVDK